MTLSRRAWTKLALVAFPAVRAAAGTNTFYKGVQLGICSYSFRTLGLDELIRQMQAVPMGQLELESTFVKPTLTFDEIRAVRRRLDDAAIDVFAYNIPINNTFTDDDLDRAFRVARLLGAQAVNSATTLNLVPRIAAAAERHNMRVGLHPSGGPPSSDSIGSGDSYRKALAISPRIGANPDLNGWRAWGPDPIAFIREIGSRITTLHTHDSKPGDPRPVAVPFGQGTNPIREVVQLMQKEKFMFVAMIERIYNLPEGADNVVELRNSLTWCREALG